MQHQCMETTSMVDEEHDTELSHLYPNLAKFESVLFVYS